MSLPLLCPRCDSSLDETGACPSPECSYTRPATTTARETAKAGLAAARQQLDEHPGRDPFRPPRPRAVHEIETADPTLIGADSEGGDEG